MKKNIKLVVIAVAVLILLSVAYLAADKFIGKPTDKNSADDPSVMDEVIVETTPLWKYSDSEIDRVEYKMNDYSYSIIVGNPFTIEGYESSLMSAINLQTAVGFVASLPVVRTVDADESKLPKYGIDDSSQTVTIHLKDGKTQTLKLGTETGVDNELYAYDVENKVLCVLTKDGANRLTADPGTYRNHKICTLNNYFLRELEVKSGDERIIGITQGEEQDSYVMTYPYEGAVVSSQKIFEFLSTFEDIKADEIVEEFPQDVSKYGFNSALNVYIFDSGQKHTLKFGNSAEEGGIYIMYGDRPVVYRGTCAVYEVLKNIDPVAYIEPHVHLVNVSSVSKVDIKKGKEHIVMERESGKEESYRINGKSEPAESFKKKYQAVIGIDYSDITDETYKGKPYCTVTFTMDDNTTQEYVYYEYDDSYCVVKGQNGLNCIVLTNNIDTMIETVSK